MDELNAPQQPSHKLVTFVLGTQFRMGCVPTIVTCCRNVIFGTDDVLSDLKDGAMIRI